MFSQILAEGSLSLCQFKDLTQCVILSVCRPHKKQNHSGWDLTDSVWTLVTQLLKVNLIKNVLYISSWSFSEKMIQEVNLKSLWVWTSLIKNNLLCLHTVPSIFLLPLRCLFFIVAQAFPCDCCSFPRRSQREKLIWKDLIGSIHAQFCGLCCKSTERRGPTCLWSCLWAVDRRWNAAHNHT